MAAPSPLTRAVHRLRTEFDTPAQEATAIGLGVFVGCTPLFGLHLPLCVALGTLLGLSRIKLYLGANISNPLLIAPLLLAEVQTGAWLRRGRTHDLTLEAVRNVEPWSFGADLLVGALVVGAILGAAAAAATYAAARHFALPERVAALIATAGDRYLPCGVSTWEFARAKLRTDPLYAQVLAQGVLPPSGTILDLGCGRGLMLALLATARERFARGDWPESWPAPPLEGRLVGMDLRPDVIEVARKALGDDAELVLGDLRAVPFERCRTVMIFDVLHMMEAASQEVLLRQILAVLDDGGTLLVREADAAEGWRFKMTRAGNWTTAIMRRSWKQRFHYRTRTEWESLLHRLGFEVKAQEMRDGTPFANVLLEAHRPLS